MIRRFSVSGRLPSRVATSHRPTAISIVMISFVRPRSPRDRRRITFVESSANPSSAHATATPKTPIARQSMSVSSRNGTAIAVKMMIPPIVGVPALEWCPSGPSSRMLWPNSRSRRNEMNLGERKMQISSEAVPAIRTSPTGQRLRDRLQPDPAGRFHQHHVARGHQFTSARRRLGRVVHHVCLAAERFGGGP